MVIILQPVEELKTPNLFFYKFDKETSKEIAFELI
jgi:hypothetical protein